MTMLACGVILLVAGALLALLVARGRDVGLLCVAGGIILIVVHYLTL